MNPELIMMTVAVAALYDLDADVFTRLVYAESAYNPRAYNEASECVGMCQINLKAWPLEDWVVPTDDPYDSWANLNQGAYVLAAMKERFWGRDKSVAAYTLGEGAINRLVKDHGRLWFAAMPAVRQEYVKFVAKNARGTRWGDWRWNEALIEAMSERRRSAMCGEEVVIR